VVKVERVSDFSLSPTPFRPSSPLFAYHHLDIVFSLQVSERVVPSVTGRSSVTTSRESPSPLSDVSLDEVVLSESPD
jgi:hypothetical protein